MQAGIPPNKLDHPSIRGPIRQYTQVHGSLGIGSTIYRNCARVGEVHFTALRQEFVKQKVWVSTDEWTDTQGHAIMNVIIGRGKAAYVCESKTLDYKGSNDGVEHKEVVTDCLQKMGIESNNVLLFICDAAAVLTAAHKHVLKPLYPDAMHISCPSHGLNGVGKAIIAELPACITIILETTPGLLHAKRQASRKRRWFTFLRRKGTTCLLPPKYIDTRWVVWGTCAEWWVDHYATFLEFLVQEKGRYAEDKVPTNLQQTIERMDKSPRAVCWPQWSSWLRRLHFWLPS